MNPQSYAASLERSGKAIQALVGGLDPETARWKPAPDSWSVLEIVSHLVDEERDDFRRRLDLVLAPRGETWLPIDPVGWATARRYNERDLGESLGHFAAERAKSLAWLRGFTAFDPAATDPQQAALHPRLALLRAGDLLAAWAAHDLLHLRQIVRVSFQRVETEARPYQTDYAGTW